jgi:diketogulonate reductase-like aldo/keto reductase
VRHPWVFAIPKASDPAHAAENAGAGALELTDAEAAEIERVFPLGSLPSTLPML